MKAEKPEGTNEATRDHRRQPDGSRPRHNGEERGPLGFDSVLRNVRSTGSTTPGMPGFDPALLQAAQLDSGANAASSMGAILSVGDELAEATVKPQNAVQALVLQDHSAVHQAQQPLQHRVPSNLGKMTPSAAMNVTIDEAKKLEISEAMKDLHIELEPEDLGPLIVRLRKGPDGALDIGFRVRESDAERQLDNQQDELHARLHDAGFLSVKISVTKDPTLTLSE